MLKVKISVLILVACATWVAMGIFEEGRSRMKQFHDQSRQSERDWMVDTQIVAEGIIDPVVISAMRRVPRHRFIPAQESEEAYGNFPLPIGYEQTISQPYIVAFMTEVLSVKPGEKVLEIGTGSGYQAAILAEMGANVFTIEIVEPLASQAKEILAELGYDTVVVRAGDGYQGWPEESPFDAVILTAAPERIPSPLLDQLAVGGRLISPVGDHSQNLVVIRRTEEGYQSTELLSVRFVPMTGETQQDSVQ